MLQKLGAELAADGRVDFESDDEEEEEGSGEETDKERTAAGQPSSTPDEPEKQGAAVDDVAIARMHAMEAQIGDLASELYACPGANCAISVGLYLGVNPFPTYRI